MAEIVYVTVRRNDNANGDGNAARAALQAIASQLSLILPHEIIPLTR